MSEGRWQSVAAFYFKLSRPGEHWFHTFCLTPNQSAHCTHLQGSSRHMPAAHSGSPALPAAAAHEALNLLVSTESRNQADNETRYPSLHHSSMPSVLLQQPRPASPHTRDALLRDFLSHSFAPHTPLILLFLPGPRSASRQGEVPTSPQSRAECPHPLCKCFTTSPTHRLILCPPNTSSTTITYSSTPSFTSPTSPSNFPPSDFCCFTC